MNVFNIFNHRVHTVVVSLVITRDSMQDNISFGRLWMHAVMLVHVIISVAIGYIHMITYNSIVFAQVCRLAYIITLIKNNVSIHDMNRHIRSDVARMVFQNIVRNIDLVSISMSYKDIR